MGFLGRPGMQFVALVSWTLTAIFSVLAWCGFYFLGSTAWRAGLNSALAVVSIFILYFWWYTANLGSGNRKFAFYQLLPTLLKVGAQTLILAAVLFVICIFFYGVTADKVGLPDLGKTLRVLFDQTFSSLDKAWYFQAAVWVGGLCAFIQVGRYLGRKGLPHLFGISFGPHWYQFNAQVRLPFFVVLFSFVAFVAGGGYLIHSFLNVGLKITPMGLLAEAGFLVVWGAWGQYFLLSGQLRKALDENRNEVARMKAGQIPKKDGMLSRFRQLIEYRVGTREWNAKVFHRLADEPYGLSYRFPGFLIGVEQTNRYLIGVPKGDNVPDEVEGGSKIRKYLNDRRRAFISHIVEFSERDPKSSDAEAISTRLAFNLYEDTAYENAFTRGFEELTKLQGTLRERLEKPNGEPPKSFEMATDSGLMEGGGYTHIVVYCMGWNTDQQESIRNYNSLMGFLFDAARNDTESRSWTDKDGCKHAKSFRPLVIGFSWPSEWSYLKSLSYLHKAGDADETGLVWGTYLLKKVLAPLKSEFHLPLVLVGHSFGARVLSRAVASIPDWIKDAPGPPYSGKMDSSNKEIDLFVGLQGAFSANRFVKTGPLTSGWMEGSPYLELKKMGTRFIFTWSENDKANPLAAFVTGANHVGGKFGSDFCLQHKDAFWPCVYAGEKEFNDEKAWQYGEGQRYDPKTGWSKSAKNEKGKIFSLDLSRIVKDQPYGKGGGAHSDIYTPEIGRFLWKTILAFAPGDFEKPETH